MVFINTKNVKHQSVLEASSIRPEDYDRALSIIKKSTSEYYRLSQMHEHFSKMLSISDIMLDTYKGYNNLPLKEKKEWESLKNLKTGERGYVNRMLLEVLNSSSSLIFNELIVKQEGDAGELSRLEPLDLVEELDAVMFLSDFSAYMSYMVLLDKYKKSVFSALKRGYISFIQIRSLHLVRDVLLAIEQDMTLIKRIFPADRVEHGFSTIGQTLEELCNRADPNHHDPLSLHAVNCLRSIYVSFFNIATHWLCVEEETPLPLREILPVIPDKIAFDKNKLEYENAWKRYQEHHFLFMRLPSEQRISLNDVLNKLSTEQRIMWMGCLGKEEIKVLVLPMLSQPSRFENLVKASHLALKTDDDSHSFIQRVFDVLSEVYFQRLSDKTFIADEIHQIFGNQKPAEPPAKKDLPPSPEAEEQTKEEIDLSVLRNLSFLVVDDSERMRQLTIKVLKEAGINQINESEDGIAAWKYLNSKKVDVVLCDWIMPDVSGIDLVRKVMQVESIAKRTAILMLTTVNDKASIVEALSIGVRGYLIKPFTKKQLLEKVYFATEWLRREQQDD